jgi:hypothetical protein
VELGRIGRTMAVHRLGRVIGLLFLVAHCGDSSSESVAPGDDDAGAGPAAGATGNAGTSGASSDAGSNDSRPATESEIAAACEAAGECGGGEARAECELSFALTVLTRTCALVVSAASCEDHATEAYADTCFPRCARESSRCNPDDTLTVCIEVQGELRLLMYRCPEVCEQRGEAHIGCGPSALDPMREICGCSQ